MAKRGIPKTHVRCAYSARYSLLSLIFSFMLPVPLLALLRAAPDPLESFLDLSRTIAVRIALSRKAGKTVDWPVPGAEPSRVSPFKMPMEPGNGARPLGFPIPSLSQVLPDEGRRC
ncbi:hypothetical protein CABS01_00227 [Colletotrichum abscissum]|uniref:uncharacterized protein n=1 Tax=Colletotrichum abscissum TaxID=1671311 RepID=UPI0027D4D46C|nr:uncharacterized protein CABS01_00227 [Colletotrichum abscissum]KAK1525138.1 hypothetical protein CABS01_00227 [Colletotrichum abscissum]